MMQLVKQATLGDLVPDPLVDQCFVFGVAQLLGEFARAKEHVHPIPRVRHEPHPGFLMFVGPRETSWDCSPACLATSRRSSRVVIDDAPSATLVAESFKVAIFLAQLGAAGQAAGRCSARLPALALPQRLHALALPQRLPA